MQKIIEILEGIATKKGVDALTDEVVEECCRTNGVDPEDFRNFICERIDLRELQKLSPEDLDKVAGGASETQKWIASLMAVANLMGTAPISAIGGEKTPAANRKEKIQRKISREKTSIVPALFAIGTGGLASAIMYKILFGTNYRITVPKNSESTNTYNEIKISEIVEKNRSDIIKCAQSISDAVQEKFCDIPDGIFSKEDHSHYIEQIATYALEKSIFRERDFEFSVKLKEYHYTTVKIYDFFRDYTCAQLYGKQCDAKPYDLADKMLAAYVTKMHPGSHLEYAKDPNYPNYATYQKLLDDILKALKLDSVGPDRPHLEQIKAVEKLQKLYKCYDTPYAKTMLELCAKYKADEEKGWSTNITSEKLRALVVKGEEHKCKILGNIRSFKENLKNPETAFERYLIEACDCIEKQLANGLNLDCPVVPKDWDYDLEKFSTKLMELGQYLNNSAGNKRQFLKNKVLPLLSYRWHIDLTKTLDDQRNALGSIADLANYVYEHNLDRFVPIKCASNATYREFLQDIFKDGYVTQEGPRIEVFQTLKCNWRCRSENIAQYTTLHDYMRGPSGYIKRISNQDSIEKLELSIEELTKKIKMSKTSQDLLVFCPGLYRSENFKKWLREVTKGDTKEESAAINWGALATKLPDTENIFTEKSFLWASFDDFCANKFSEDDTEAIFCHVTVPRGTSCAYYDYDPAHLVFLPGTKLRLKEVTVAGGAENADGTTFGTKEHPLLVTLNFEMVQPTDNELKETEKEINGKAYSAYIEVFEKNYEHSKSEFGRQIVALCQTCKAELESDDSDRHNLEKIKKMYPHYQLLKHIDDLVYYLSDTKKTDFEQYLVDVCEYYGEKIQNDPEHFTDEKKLFDIIKNLKEFMLSTVDLASNKEVHKQTIEKYLNSLKKLLDSHFETTIDRTGKLTPLLAKTPGFLNHIKQLDPESIPDKPAFMTGREFLQTIFKSNSRSSWALFRSKK